MEYLLKISPCLLRCLFFRFFLLYLSSLQRRAIRQDQTVIAWLTNHNVCDVFLLFAIIASNGSKMQVSQNLGHRQIKSQNLI